MLVEAWALGYVFYRFCLEKLISPQFDIVHVGGWQNGPDIRDW